jgi:hypothetical protein
VADPPDTVSHGVDVETVKEMFCETTLEATPTVLADGAADVPSAIEKDALEEASTRSADCGRTLRLTPCNADAGGTDESVTLTVKV